MTGTFRSELLSSAMFCPQEPSPSITNLSEQPCVFAAGINPLECLFFESLAEDSLVRGSFGNARAGEHSWQAERTLHVHSFTRVDSTWWCFLRWTKKLETDGRSMRSSLFNLYTVRLSLMNILPVWKIKKLQKTDKEREGQRTGWVTHCIMTLILHGNANNNRSRKPSERNRSRNWNNQLWQSTETMNDLSVFPHVYALVHEFVLKPRSCYEDWLSSSCCVCPSSPHVIHFPLRGPILHISRYISSQTNDPINYLTFCGLTSET